MDTCISRLKYTWYIVNHQLLHLRPFPLKVASNINEYKSHTSHKHKLATGKENNLSPTEPSNFGLEKNHENKLESELELNNLARRLAEEVGLARTAAGTPENYGYAVKPREMKHSC